MADRWLLVGLGNPGEKYAHTRHNVGHDTIDVLASRMGVTLKRHQRARARYAEGRLGIGPGGVPGPACVIATLTCYMNESGTPTRQLADYFGIGVDRLLVIHDDLDLDAHDLRLKCGGGEGGHNGLRSLSAAWGTRAYARLRIGIGRPPGRQDPADYVLQAPPRRERDDWAVTFERAGDVCEDVLASDFLAAQQRLHTR